MKTILALIVSFLSLSAQANVECNSLSSFVGDYKLTSQTCQGPWGNTLNVAPYATTSDSGYMFHSGNIGIGPSLSANSTDRCVVDGSTVTVTTGANDQWSIPQRWIYTFNGTGMSFQANGCFAQFSK